MTKGQEDRMTDEEMEGAAARLSRITALRARVADLEGALRDVQPILATTRLISCLGERHLAIEARVTDLLGRRT